MPHVALILRVETDSNTASFRNLLYWVSQLLMGFSFDEKKLKCWYLILHIKTLLLIITEKILRVSLLEGLMWKWRVVTWLKTNQKHTWNNANYTKYNLATQRLLLQFTLFGMLKQVFFKISYSSFNTNIIYEDDRRLNGTSFSRVFNHLKNKPHNLTKYTVYFKCISSFRSVRTEYFAKLQWSVCVAVTDNIKLFI